MTTPSPSPNGKEGRGKPIVATDESSAVRLTLQVDNTSALPIFLQGRTVAIRGGELDRYTLDAKEPIQRQHIHTQLEQARRLRTTLEDAASKLEAPATSSSSATSKKSRYVQAMNILQSSLPHMQELEKLTNSLEGGGYATTNFHGNDREKGRKRQRREELLEKKRLREQQIIRKHLREFVRESNPSAKMDDDNDDDEEEMNGQESLIDEEMNVQLEGTDVMKGTTTSSSSPHEKNLEVSLSSFSGRATTPRPTTTNKSSSKRKSSYSLEDQTRKKSSKPDLKRSKSNESSRQDDARRKIVQEGKKNKRSDKQPASRKVPQDVISSSSISRPSSSMSNVSKKSTPAPVVPKKIPKPRAVKKCHDCRKSSNRHRVCNFWKLSGFTGAKCGKVFCIDCLTSKYSVGDDVHGSKNPDGKSIEEIMRDPTLDSEWHCPSCLGVCQCHVCVAHRKREEEREKNRGDGERKSLRRTTAHSSYYNFF